MRNSPDYAANHMQPFAEEMRKKMGIDPDIEIRVLAHRELGVDGRIIYKICNRKVVGCDIRVDEFAGTGEAENVVTHELRHLKKRCERKTPCETDAYLAGTKRELYYLFGQMKNFISRNFS